MSRHSDLVESLNPIAYWRLGEAVGQTIAVDEMGSYNGTYVNTPTLGVDGLVELDSDTAVEFDGVDQYLDLDSIVSEAITHTQGSVSFITKFPTGGEARVAFYGDVSDTARYAAFFVNVNAAYFIHRNADVAGVSYYYIKTDRTFSIDTEYRITYVQDATHGVLIYVDGVEVPTSIVLGTPGDKWFDEISFIDSFAVGAYQNTTTLSYYEATVDELAIFDYRLTAQNIEDLCRASKAYAFDIAIDHTLVLSDLYDFPVLVNLDTDSGITDFDTNRVFDELFYDIDRNFSTSVLMLRLTGAAASTTFTDISTSPSAITVQGQARISSFNDPFGEANGILFLDGNEDSIYTATSQGNISTGDVTFECWVKPETGGGANGGILGTSITSSYNERFCMGLTNASSPYILQAYSQAGSDTGKFINTDSLIYEGVWTHVVLQRTSGTGKLFINGVQKASGDLSNDIDSGVIRVGHVFTGSTNQYMKGYLSDISCHYTSVYSANFDKPTRRFPTGTIDSSEVHLLIPRYSNPDDNVSPVSMDDDFTGTNGDQPNREIWFNSTTTYHQTANTGGLKIDNNSVTADIIDAYCAATTKPTIDGDFDVQVDTVWSENTATTERMDLVTIFYHATYTDTYMLYRQGDKIYRYSSLSGVTNTTATAVNSNVTVKLKITRVGNALKSYIDSGGGWSEIFSDTLAFNSSMRVKLMTRNGTINTNHLDNFKVNSGTIVWPTPADTSVMSKKCYMEIDRWDQVTKQAQLWVRVPYISKDVDTIINFSFDKTNVDNSEYVGATGTIPAQTVWSEYDAVYHLSKDGADSSTNELDGTLVNIDGTNIVDFGVGKGISFNGTNEWIDIGFQSMFNIDVENENKIFVEQEAEYTDNSGHYRSLQNRGTGGYSGEGFQISTLGSTNHFGNTLFDGFDTNSFLHMGTSYPFAAGVRESDTFIFDVANGDLLGYRDGVLVEDGSGNSDKSVFATEPVYTRNTTIGCAWDSAGTQSQFMKGKLKEIRFTKTIKSDEWISANYESTQDSLVLYNLANELLLNKFIRGSITESLAVTQWLIRSYNITNGALIASMASTNGDFELTIPIGFWYPQAVTVIPDQGDIWVAQTAYALDDLVMSTDPVTNPYYYKCTTAGTSGSTEPTWPTSSTVNDGTVVWTYVDGVTQPITHSPLVPVY